MTRIVIASLCLVAGAVQAAESPPVPPPTATPAPAASPPLVAPSDCGTATNGIWDGASTDGALFESDRCFPNFIGPISNPVLSKDPRALTEARALFLTDSIPHDHPLGGGDFQVYGLQVRVALTDRLSFIADKDGVASIHPGVGKSETGALDIAAGLKYAFIRDVENQFLVDGGFMFEPQTGESNVFQGQGTGLFTLFLTGGKEFGDCYHILGNTGYQLPVDRSQNSSFFYTSLHLDKQMFGWLYPLVELNWFHWTGSGDRGLPSALGEGDGLINFGTSGVAGNDLVTVAVGLKAILNRHMDIGVAYETPISTRQDLIENRVLAELIFRY